MWIRWHPDEPVRLEYAISRDGEIQQHLPAWVLTLPGVSFSVKRLGVVEFRRRLFHMSPSIGLIGVPFIPHKGLWGLIFFGLLVMSGVSLGLALAYRRFMTRPREKSWMGAVLGYMLPVVTPLLIFPDHPEFGLMTLQILALGDGSATLAGKMFPIWRLPWNRHKTFAGLLCFTLMGTLGATYSYWGESPNLQLRTIFLICSGAALCAAIVESLPIRSNDNFRVGTTALIVGFAMTSLLS